MSWQRQMGDAGVESTEVVSQTELAAIIANPQKHARRPHVGGSPELGSRVGHFELLSFLGRGGTGEVYKARDTRLDRIVALKLLLPGPEALEQRFQREARAQAKIQHDAVCSVFEVGVAEGRPFIAMQYIEGQTLGEAASELTLEEKVLVIRQVAEAIHVAHTQALVHRDLKPGNIMLQSTDSALRAWVLDFGMVHITGDAQLTSTGELLGSPCYMAPEQIAEEVGAIDRRTDIYGLGTVFYDILVDRPPFEGKNILDVLRKVATEEPLAPRHLRPEIPVDLEWIVLRCLEKDPGRRYRSVLALIEDLDRFRRGEPVRARQGSWRYRSKKWLFRRRRALSAAAVLLALVLGLLWRDFSQRRMAQQTARLTADFLREKKEVEWRLRAISMLPLHDTRPERERLLERLDRLEEQVRAAGEIGKGPGFFALGRGYQVLGWKERSLSYLEQSWEQGFRDPRLSFSLGLAYSELYDESLVRLALEPDPELRQEQRREAESRFRTPATQHLQAAREGQREDSAWVASRVAAHEQRWDAAFAALEEVEKSSPWFYETHALRALILHRQALSMDSKTDMAEIRALLDRAEDALARAIRIGESDTAMYVKLCSQRDSRLSVFQEPLPISLEERWKMFEPCRQAVETDSGSARAYAVAAQTARSLGEASMSSQRERGSLLFLEESVRLADRALSLNPDHIRALQESAEAHLNLAVLSEQASLRDQHLDRAHESARRLKELDLRTGALLFSKVLMAQTAHSSQGSGIYELPRAFVGTPSRAPSGRTR